MATIINDHCHDITRVIEVFENERYQLSAMDWSSQGLLPTDRKAISTRDGRAGWVTFDQAGEALISRGWSWAENTWTIDCHFPGSDSDGWSYASNFGSIDQNGTAIKGMSHFVRRRRRTRKQIFVANNEVSGTCDHCDSMHVDLLSDKLLEALTQTSLHEYPGESPPAPATNRLKDLLMETLGLASISERFDMKHVHHVLDKFLTLVLNKKSAWSKAASIFGGEYSPEQLPQRAKELDRDAFTSEERREIAKLLIRKYDTDNEYHCEESRCGSSCVFAPYYCNNDGCTAVFSMKWRDQHDGICPFKVVDCTRECGERVARRDMNRHLEESCNKRPAHCPFSSLGCSAAEMTHRDLPEHLEEATQGHLLLVTCRMMEQQQVIVKMHKKINELESRASEHAGSITTLQAGAAAVMASLRTLERSEGERESSVKSLESMERKLDKELANMKNTVKTLERDVDRQTARIGSVETSLTGLQSCMQGQKNGDPVRRQSSTT